MHNVFFVSLRGEDSTRKEWVDERMTELKLEAGNSKEYKVEAIWDSAVYISNSESGQLPSLYYLEAWKRYLEEENAWEPSSAVQQLKKLINSFYKDYPEKLIGTFPPIDSTLPMARLTIRLNFTLKRKRDQPDGVANKQAKNCVFRYLWHLINSPVKTSVLDNTRMQLA